MKLKRGSTHFKVVFNIDLPICSATSLESPLRDLLNDMAEHRPILKNSQNTNHPRFGFTLKTGIALPKTGVCFYNVKVYFNPFVNILNRF